MAFIPFLNFSIPPQTTKHIWTYSDIDNNSDWDKTYSETTNMLDNSFDTMCLFILQLLKPFLAAKCFLFTAA